VTSTAANLQKLCETMLGLAPGMFGAVFREVTIQMDPVTSSALSCMFGNANVGVTLNSVVQAGMVLSGGTASPNGGISDTIRSAAINGVYFGSIWAKAVTSTVTLNIQAWEI
jgi:hypothetical protein